MKKKIYFPVAVLAVGAASCVLFSWDMGTDISPMAKFFLIFFGAIIVLQIIPAAVLFICMVKEMFFRSSRPAEKNLLAENQGEHSAR